MRTSNNNFQQDENKQFIWVFSYLLSHEGTAIQVSQLTGIPQKNIRCYKRSLEQQGKLCDVCRTILPNYPFSSLGNYQEASERQGGRM